MSIAENEENEILTIDEIKRLHDKCYEHGKISREKAADDLVFYWLTQWDDNLLGQSSLGYKGQFDIIRKGGRQIISDLRTNPVQINFYQRNETDDSAADIMDGFYRTTTQENSSIEAFDNAKSEAVVCGLGGWELYTEYETNSTGDKNQSLQRRPIHEFNNVAFADPSSRLIDKSDADMYSLLVPYSRDGMKELAEELTGEDYDIDAMTFKDPEHSYVFPWSSGKDEIFYAVRFYHRTKVCDKILTISDPAGGDFKILESSINDEMGDFEADGFKIIDEKEITRKSVRLYICNGHRILDHYEIAGDNIPIVAAYGERAIIEGEEHYEGCTRLAKDPQRLRNFQMSYLADIVSRTPRPQPIFLEGQLSGFEWMYEENGADSYLPYLLQKRFDANGNEFPVGPVGQMPEQPISNALMQSIALSREAVGDVVPANVPQDIADIDLSGKALANLQNRLDEQSLIYQQNHKHALRRDAEIAAGMAKVILDSPRSITITKPDGKRINKRLMDNVFDIDTGEIKTVNDITGAEFDVFADIGPDYSTKKEQTIDQLDKMTQTAIVVNPQLAEMLFLKQIELVDGINFDDVRKYARKQALIKGFAEPDPENEEEMQLIQDAQQNQQPDPNMVMAQAEQAKADANMAEVQRKTQADQFNAQTAMLKGQVEQFDASTRRLAVQVDAQEADANINFKRIDSMTKRLEVINKSQLRASVNV